jgi:hypothetical protein
MVIFTRLEMKGHLDIHRGTKASVNFGSKENAKGDTYIGTDLGSVN